jgi:hypothetical protein
LLQIFHGEQSVRSRPLCIRSLSTMPPSIKSTKLRQESANAGPAIG